jgi:large subunit ribosomal protein L7e
MVTTQLRPKNEGEALKVAKVVLKRKDRNLVANADRARIIQKIRMERKSRPKVVKAIEANKLFRQCKKNKMDKEHAFLSKHKQWLQKEIPSDAACLLVARNSRTPSLPKVKGILKTLGLVRPNDCRIIATTDKNLDSLRFVEAYLYFGVPTPEIVSTLVHKKAYVAAAEEAKTTTTPAKAVPLNNNAIIEDVLGGFGLVCVEDLVEVLLKGKNDDRFEKVSSFISTFKLNPENKELDAKFRNSRPTRGFQTRIETFMKRVL